MWLYCFILDVYCLILLTFHTFISSVEKFTLITVFVIIDGTSFYDHTALRECVIEKLALIPNHTKLVVAPYNWGRIQNSPETIYVAMEHKPFFTSLIEIFNKRWQKLDLVSMMQELSRTLPRYFRSQAHYELKEDKLSTLPRFQKMQEEGSL